MIKVNNQYLIIIFSFMLFIGLFAPINTIYAGGFDAINSSLESFKGIFRILIYLGASVAFLFFVWGVAKYISSSGTDSRNEAKSTIFKGIIGIFVIFSIWGIVSLLQGVFGV